MVEGEQFSFMPEARACCAHLPLLYVVEVFEKPWCDTIPQALCGADFAPSGRNAYGAPPHGEGEQGPGRAGGEPQRQDCLANGVKNPQTIVLGSLVGGCCLDGSFTKCPLRLASCLEPMTFAWHREVYRARAFGFKQDQTSYWCVQVPSTPCGSLRGTTFKKSTHLLVSTMPMRRLRQLPGKLSSPPSGSETS